MNDLMSLGVHRLWKRFAIGRSGVHQGDRVLDVAGGSGDLALQFAERVGTSGEVILTDINKAMLGQGRSRMIDLGIMGNVRYIQCDAEQLCFPNAAFDCVSISFGLRNVTRIPKALKAMKQVLKPGGRLLILEFSKPAFPLLEELYDIYSFNMIPRLGGLVTGDRESYQYLVESIRKHPDQLTLKKMMEEAGLERVSYHNLSGGIVALHVGFSL
jgi:demethylmenaquinone methyltransferase/2-methoxy-6-polyprenyl-1,4-benzoquinol methylase